MNYKPNTQKWGVGWLVLHDCDSKEPRSLMEVVGFTRDGLYKTQYLFKSRKRKIWKNELKYLHDPRPWLGDTRGWRDYGQERLDEIQRDFERVQRWNASYQVGQMVMTTSADGGFISTTRTTALFVNNAARIWLHYVDVPTRGMRGGCWNLEFVVPVLQPITLEVPRE